MNTKTPDDVRVPVADDQGRLIEWVPPAVARFAIKQGAATVQEQEPFTIRLKPGLDVCPRPARSFSEPLSVPEVVRGIARGRDNMSDAQINLYNPAQRMFDVVEFFDKVEKPNGNEIVWVKSTAPRGAQVILELQNGQGQRIKVPPVKPGDPVCLSRFAKFEFIKNSPDLIQNANNGLLRLMTHEEANAFFQRKATLLKTTPQELMAKAEANARNSVFKKELQVAQVDRSQKIVDTQVAVQDVVHPRIEALCAGVHPMLKEEQRTSVNELMSEVFDLAETLTMEDLEYLRANGYYPSVKKWAEKQQHALAESQGLIPSSDDLSE